MNLWMVSAGVLSLLLIPVHTFLGGPEVLSPIVAGSFDPVVEGVITVVWQAINVVMLVNGLMLLVAAVKPRFAVGAGAITALQYLGFSVLFWVYGISQLGNVIDMSQWVPFSLIAVLAIMGGERKKTQVSAPKTA